MDVEKGHIVLLIVDYFFDRMYELQVFMCCINVKKKENHLN